MSAPNDRDPVDETALAALFDRSARAPSDVERSRLSARAEQIAERARPRRVATSVVWPAALAAAAGVAYLAIAPPRGERGATQASSAAEPTRTSPPIVSAAAPTSGHAPTEGTATEQEPEDPATAVLGGEPEDRDPLDLGPLMRGGEGEGARRKPR